ncbi:MAG: hypothetical protein KGZ79_08985 [Dethiobacter sp.]|jgi:hypothetical protein|nr:hypothetical protein [Dethiobacter sp.]
MRIGFIDADLIDNGTRHPNLALMKLSGYMKNTLGYETELLFDYNSLESFDKVYISKVFTFTKINSKILTLPNVEYGGTGFLPEEKQDLPTEIEHHMPDYHLYDKFVEKEIGRGIKPQHFSDYMDYSIGFATRGCFRKCSFCVNKKYDRVVRHAKVSEFVDPTRKYIYLWDDNILGYENWREVFDELAETKRYFQFRQGIDIRLMTEEKASVLSKAKYKGDYIFAFDYLKDRELIERKLNIWRKYCSKTTKLYILCAYESQDVNDIISVFERISVLMKYRCLPYIMRYDTYKQSEFAGLYINIARWCNQPNFFKKKSFREYCEANGEKSSTVRYLRDFENKHPDIAKKYFDLKFETVPRFDANNEEVAATREVN